ncbi:MAG: spore coat protein H [Parcubacteria group bacterium Gr01-1014_70]|nr:MAG: spore coat protein H [Parcubacteria group bacterium Gr01-1014_70]
MNEAKHNKRIIAVGIAVLCATVGFGAAVFTRTIEEFSWEYFLWRLDSMYESSHTFVRHFSPTWRSLKKIGDVLYMPQTLFYTSNLPVYELELKRSDVQLLLDSLPIGTPYLTDEYKTFVKGIFRYNDLETEARVRYRGWASNHWNARKKSFSIELLDEAIGEHTRTLRLVIPEDRGWVAEPFEAYRAQKFGVLTPSLEYVKLRLNGHDLGVYMVIERLDESFLKRNQRPVGEIFSNIDAELDSSTDLLSIDNVDYWSSRIDEETNHHKEHLSRFLYVLSKTTDEEFAEQIPRILDMERMYGWMLQVLLASSYHQSNSGNLNFYYDSQKDIFEPIVNDVRLHELGDAYNVGHHRLMNRILSHEPFRAEFEQYVRAYVQNPQHLEDDLLYYDSVVTLIEKDIMADTAKLPPTSLFFTSTEQYRKEIIANFEKVRGWLEAGNVPLQFVEETYPL